MMSFSKRIIIPIGFSILLLILRIIATGELTYIFFGLESFPGLDPICLKPAAWAYEKKVANIPCPCSVVIVFTQCSLYHNGLFAFETKTTSSLLV